MATVKLRPLIVILGETASGKSGLATELARNFNGELISADSWAVYREFNIGTAKPNEVEQAETTHHLIDIADPKIGFSAAEFKRQASNAIEAIFKKGKNPILVGGTGLYIDSLLFNYNFLPAGPSSQRKRLNGLSIQELLQEVDSKDISLVGIDSRNKRRLIRLIEVNGQRPSHQDLRSNTLIIGLKISRAQLEIQITKRVDEMLGKGLEQEVIDLAKKYGWQAEPMKGIGYREWKAYFDGGQNLEQTRQQIITNTLQLAKKQRTWFKRNNSIHWVDSQTAAIDLVKEFLNK